MSSSQHDATRPIDVAGDALHVRRVFGESYEAGGAVIIPVAKVMGGSGMGYGSGTMGDDGASPREGTGGGGTFGVRAKPVGVYVARDGKVSWQPAMDLNRVILGGQVLGAIAVVALTCALRRRWRWRSTHAGHGRGRGRGHGRRGHGAGRARSAEPAGAGGWRGH